jgi:superfamily I DNA/RNA helicase
MTPDHWAPTDGIVLEPNALRAVHELERNVAVAAGPGSGKTELLAQRANFLFETASCQDPRKIVAISFKVDAARNLRGRVSERCKPGAERRFDSFTFHAFARQLIARHRPHVAHRVLSDFRVGPGRSPTQLHYDELLPLAHEVLDRDPAATEIVRQAYAFAFFDEFQDCTPDQFELLKRLFANSQVRTTAVGDPKQRIMGWANALDDAMSDYVNAFGAVKLQVYLNHRSQLRLRRVQNAVVRVMDPTAAMSDADLVSPVVDGVPTPDGNVQVHQFPTAGDEALALTGAIAADIENGTLASEIAILAARQPAEHCEDLVRLLGERGIPVRDEKDAQDAFAEPVGELILDAARLIVLGHAPDEYLRAGQFMTRNCVDERQAAKRRLRLDQFLEQTRRARADGSIHLDNSAEMEGVLYAFLKLCERQFLSRLSVEYADDEALTSAAGKAIAAITNVFETSTTPEAAMSRLSHEDSVRLMTVHKSKGLEFDHVYFVAIENESFFGTNFDDERSTFFVGISRARSKLVLTHARERPMPSSSPYRWSSSRTGQAEFLGYAVPQQA